MYVEHKDTTHTYVAHSTADVDDYFFLQQRNTPQGTHTIHNIGHAAR